MNSLADEILGALPALIRDRPAGATVEDVRAAVAVTAPQARAAMISLHEAGRAMFFRYPTSRRMHLLPAGALGATRVCPICSVLFERPRKSRAVCCSRPCSVSWSWENPETAAKRAQAIRTAKATPEAKERQRLNNERRWADPEQHARLSEQNRLRWADPAQCATRSAAIQRANGSAERRAAAAAIRKALWADPDYRARAQASINACKSTGEHRAWMAQEMKRRWADPVLRETYLAAAAKNRGKAADAVRGVSQTADHRERRLAAVARSRAAHPHKQSPEHIRKRMESIARNRAARLAMTDR